MCRSGSWSWTFPPSEISWNCHHHFLPSRFNQTSKNEPSGNCDAHTSGDQASLLIMTFVVMGTEEWWETEWPWHSSSWVLTLLPAGGGVEALQVVDAWLTDTVGCEPMEDNNSIGVWRIRVKSNSPDFHFDSDRLTSWSWKPLSPSRLMDITFSSTLSF